jgi:4-amino-4-deoxy-L-arabinose transferase-like glycosyltransferase
MSAGSRLTGASPAAVRAGRAECWRDDSWKFAALLLLAASLRGVVLWEFGGMLAEDRDNYRRIAGHIAAGAGFIDPQTLLPTAYRPPLYPVLLAGVLRCGGGTMAIGVVQLLLGVATVALTVACGYKLKLGQGSLMAGLLVACDPLLLHHTALVMTETTAAFLAALLLWASLQRQSPKHNFSMGIVLGLASLCRPTFWAFGGLGAMIWGGRFVRRSRRTPALHRKFGLIELALMAGIVVAVAPWAIRNAFVMGRPIVTTAHGGYTLLLAHNPAYTHAVVDQPWGAVWEGEPQANWVAEVETEMAQEDPPIDVTHISPAVELARDGWMSRKAWKYIRDEPVVAVRAGLTLLRRMWNVVPLATDRTTRSATVRLAIGAYYSGMFLAVLVGAARKPRGDWLAWQPVLVLIVSFTAVHALYWADMRMRAPLVPAVALLATAGLSFNRDPKDFAEDRKA